MIRFGEIRDTIDIPNHRDPIDANKIQGKWLHRTSDGKTHEIEIELYIRNGEIETAYPLKGVGVQKKLTSGNGNDGWYEWNPVDGDFTIPVP